MTTSSLALQLVVLVAISQAGSASSPTKPCGSMWIDVDADCGRIASPTTSPTTPCVPHAGLVTQSWYDPYRNAVLPDRLRNIAYKNTTVDCNPASCDNPPQCGIPPCRTIRKADYPRAVYVSRGCSPAHGCGLETTNVTTDEPNEDSKWSGMLMMQPATRVGVLSGCDDLAGVVQCYPSPGRISGRKAPGWRTLGSWLAPGSKIATPIV